MDRINEDIIGVKSPQKLLTQVTQVGPCERLDVPSKRFVDKET
jgi:hypothetical protein